jgi:PD-(D/E)XK nuclease superfamily protein
MTTELTTDQKGAIAEAKIAAAAIELGAGVLRPVSDGERYDLIFDLHPTLLRVQCKWATRQGDVIVIPFYSSRRAPEGFRKRSYVSGEVDAIAAYCSTLGRSFLLPVSEVPRKTYAQLRLRPCKNNQRALVNWASEYDFAATLKRLAGP